MNRHFHICWVCNERGLTTCPPECLGEMLGICPPCQETATRQECLEFFAPTPDCDWEFPRDHFVSYEAFLRDVL